jgi:hypothetical protein
VSEFDIEKVAGAVPGHIERVLALLKSKVEARVERGDRADKGEAGGSSSRRGQGSSRELSMEALRSNKEVRELLDSKDEVIAALKEAIECNLEKVSRLDQMIRLKDGKLQALIGKLAQAGG